MENFVETVASAQMRWSCGQDFAGIRGLHSIIHFITCQTPERTGIWTHVTSDLMVVVMLCQEGKELIMHSVQMVDNLGWFIQIMLNSNQRHEL